MPAFNVSDYIIDAIQSVLNQTYSNFELLIINDGSTDNTKNVIQNFCDSRIKYFEQENKGVSAARNVGLVHMSGNYFCFLDADDEFPKTSLESRLNVFDKSEDILFVDGTVQNMGDSISSTQSIWSPHFTGCPLKDLVKLTGKSFFGLTWMIKRDRNRTYSFNEKMTHCEDLLFYMELARDSGFYTYTNETILHYRDTPNSAMKNLEGLENGYRQVENEIKQWKEISNFEIFIFDYKFKKAMFKAYIKKLNFARALRIVF
ncbi:MAG: teichuronic acid biosynthesis glycosyltransferase TuaG [Marivirga sp.]|jgi:teichuronic acid biosynthesis glycosyltransferase TuaG